MLGFGLMLLYKYQLYIGIISGYNYFFAGLNAIIYIESIYMSDKLST